ncbi:MAG: polysaccharide biosynthesis tyrosine autokinase [Lentisphaerae bacterium]|nr:polysaccharide biosynthesis tyrosine autokinase [Lentisphaerota bacterium]
MADTRESLHFLDYWRVITSRKEIVIAVSLLVILSGVLVSQLMPRVYMGSTLIEVREETPDVDPFGAEAVRFNPFFLPTQFEIIQSRPILDEVIRRQNLVEKLGTAYGYMDDPLRFEITYRVLSNAMQVQQYRDTNLIEIRIRLSEPKDTVCQEVAEAANMVADVFRDQRMQRSRDETERALSALLESYEQQKRRVQEQEQKVEEIRKRYGLDVLSRELGTDSELAKRSLATIEEQRLQARLELAASEARLNNVDKLSAQELREAAMYLVEDPALIDLVTRKNRISSELDGLREAFGAKHPTVVANMASIAALDAQIERTIAGLRVGMRAAYDAARKKYEILEEQAEEMKKVVRNAESAAFLEFNEAQQELAHARRIRDVLETRYLQERIRLQIPRTIVEMIERAQPPDAERPVSPNLLLNIILSVLVGLGAGMGLAFFIEYMDTSIKTIEDIEQYVAAPVLGVIPQKVKPFTPEDAAPANAESYRVLRTNIRFSKKMTEGKMICCTSGSVGEGKSLTVFNLGVVCGEMGDRTLIVDADLHRPRQHRMIGVSNDFGLANVLVGALRLEEAIVATRFPNVSVMPSGRLPSGAHGLLDTRKMKEIMGTLAGSYDIVLFDTPPILGVSDTSLLAREMDGVLLVIQHRKYPRAVSKRARDILENMGANLVGVVLNNVNISRDYSYYYYHHYYYRSRYGKGRDRQQRS